MGGGRELEIKSVELQSCQTHSWVSKANDKWEVKGR